MTEAGLDDVRRAAELAARHSYGRLVAYLAARSGDVASAEDALGDAFVAALRTWPRDGVPDRPEAWLLTAARRRLIDAVRRADKETDALVNLRPWVEEAAREADSSAEFPDDRLRLLFVCAHPALDPAARTPLMLQAVLGFTAARIASAFLVSPSAMSQRLVRAKTKIRDTRFRFEVPEETELPARLDFVLEAIYAAYGSGWGEVQGGEASLRDLTEEALWLGRLLVERLPGEPEAVGLLALMLHCEARRPARRDADGSYVQLSEQDVTLWTKSMIAEAERLLFEAARVGRLGRFQLEAAIQSAHTSRILSGRANWSAVVRLYDELLMVCPTVGAAVNRAAAVTETDGPSAALDALARLCTDDVRDYQPYWALTAHLYRRIGLMDDAKAATQRAAGLTEDPAVRAFLLRHERSVEISNEKEKHGQASIN